MSDVSELLEQVKAATGPDRELDTRIWQELSPGATRKIWSYTHEASGRVCVVDETRDETGRLIVTPSLTASIDAALALVERVLPGWVLEHLGDNATGVRGRMKLFGATAELSDGEETTQADGATRPLAILAALLTALKGHSPHD